MSLREVIQKRVLLQASVRKHRRINSKKAFISLSKASTIGLIADFRQAASPAPASDFYKKIKSADKQINVLLFVGEKRTTINIYDYEKLFQEATVYLVCPEDLNMFQVPARSVITRFAQPAYDIVFRFELAENFSLDMALLKTRAQMYAGIEHPLLDYVDFSLNLSPNAGYNGLSNNLIQYVSRLNESQKKTK